MQNTVFERVNHNVSLVNERKKYKGNTVVGESGSSFVGKFSANGVDIKVSLGERVVPNYFIVSDMNLRTFHGLFVHVHFFYRRTFILPPPQLFWPYYRPHLVINTQHKFSKMPGHVTAYLYFGWVRFRCC